MKMVIGLGNYGPEFENTRHNIGYEIVKKAAGKLKWIKEAHWISTIDHKKNIMYVMPIDGMNVSGPSLEKLRKKYQIEVDDIIVIHDDMDFIPGQVKIKFDGGDGKHNGLKTIIENMGSNFCRIRVGIGKPKSSAGIDFVLGKFQPYERKLINAAIEDAAAAVNIILNESISSAMQFFNQKKR